jgi:hypothetical protein
VVAEVGVEAQEIIKLLCGVVVCKEVHTFGFALCHVFWRSGWVFSPSVDPLHQVWTVGCQACTQFKQTRDCKMYRFPNLSENVGYFSTPTSQKVPFLTKYGYMLCKNKDHWSFFTRTGF